MTEYTRQPLSLATGRVHHVKLPPRVMRCRLTGFLFETNKTFLLPSALAGVRGLTSFYDAHPDMKVLITGHTDTVGPTTANLALSKERAEAVAAFLTDDAEAWLRHYRGNPGSSTWGTREDQYMLKTLPAEGTPYLTGPVTGFADVATQGAIKRFQTEHGLVVDGIAGDNTRRALITDYMGLDDTSLPAGTEMKIHGCGENHPAVPTPDETAEEQNRRVEVFLFEGPIEPPPQGSCPSPGCVEYPEWVAQSVLTIDLDSPLVTPIRLLIVDRDYHPLASKPCELAVNGAVVFAGRTDSSGFLVSAPLPPAETCVLRWNDREDAEDGEYFYRETIRLRFADGEDGVAERLHNLGYRSPPTLRDAVLAYQRDNRLPETGNAGDIRDDLIATQDNHAPRPRVEQTEPLVMSSENGP